MDPKRIVYPSQLLFLTILHPLLLLFTSSASVTVGKAEFWTWILELARQWTWLQEFKCTFILY